MTEHKFKKGDRVHVELMEEHYPAEVIDVCDIMGEEYVKVKIGGITEWSGPACLVRPLTKGWAVEGILVASIDNAINKILEEMEVNKNDIMPFIKDALKKVMERLDREKEPK